MFKLRSSAQVGRTTGKGTAMLALGGVLAMLPMVTACQKDEVVHVVTAKGADDPPPTAAGAQGSMAGSADQVPMPPAPSGSQALKWTLPAGWTESHPGGMRYATLKPGADSPLEISVVALAGTAGGEVANVNRWRGQLGLAPADRAAQAKDRKVIKSAAGDVAVHDFAGEGEKKSRMIAATFMANGTTWFVKLVGDAALVEAIVANYTQLLESLHFDA